MDYNPFGYSAKGQLFDMYRQAEPDMQPGIVAAILGELREEQARNINTQISLGAGAVALGRLIGEMFFSRKKSA